MRRTFKDGTVFSIRLRNGSFALLQKIRDGRFAVFNLFRERDEWSSDDVSSDNVLFYCVITKSVLQRSDVRHHKHVKGAGELVYPDFTINLSGGHRHITLWEGTANERTFLMMGNGSYGVWRSVCLEGKIKEDYTLITIKDYDRYRHLELSNLRVYPEFNERLYLCSIFKCNIDPLKEIAFDRPLDPQCRVYVDIISGKVPLSDLGYGTMKHTRTTARRAEMAMSNAKLRNREFLADMYSNDYFPKFLVDKIKAILVDLCEKIERRQPKNEKSLLKLTHAATKRINGLAEEFEENDSELETGAREAIGAEFEFIVRAYGFPDVDIEDVIAPRDW